MAEYNIFYRKSAQNDIDEIGASDRLIILQKIRRELTDNPFPRGKTIKKLQGFDLTIYRLRINALQSYRVFYQLQGEQVIIIRIVAKKDADKVIKILKKYL